MPLVFHPRHGADAPQHRAPRRPGDADLRGASLILAEDPRPILVVGIGNTLRGDDAAGPEVALRLQSLVGPHLHVVATFQLLPELALDVSEARAAVLVDASVEISPGRVSVARVRPIPVDRGPLGHHVGPAEIVDLALKVFGRAPPTWIVSIGARTFDLGTGLSPEVEHAASRVVRRLLRLLDARTQGKADGSEGEAPIRGNRFGSPP